MKFVKIMIIASAFYLTYAHAREIHQAVDEPAAPYNLRWGMSYDEARNTPLYSLEVSDINYAGKDPDLIISTLTPQEVGALKYQEMKLYFDKNKGLKSVFVREGANKQVISSQADSLIKISRIWADFFPANTSNQPI
ncbi:hypothetical protein AZZ74_000403 [Klebsiella pneumoniae]|nr:hypothetical protein [Klebsiella pneumoniae]MCL0546839.1 hypothetical protein [Klebsiella pneumoniae]MCL0671778.1 hypothetical protein [Klebsiella pneumoniae]MCS6542728.1 hypothetical protein [Klebsiella pneumoniae]MDZ1503653.1 hypothetical protein [Klebsiella pneumoniae]